MPEHPDLLRRLELVEAAAHSSRNVQHECLGKLELHAERQVNLVRRLEALERDVGLELAPLERDLEDLSRQVRDLTVAERARAQTTWLARGAWLSAIGAAIVWAVKGVLDLVGRVGPP